MILPEYNVMSKDLNALLATLKTEIPSLEENIQNIPIAIISVHGWTPKALIKLWKIDKKSDEMAQNMTKEVCKKLGIEEEQGNITKIPLKGFGTVLDRVDKFSKEIEEKEEWLNGIKNAKLLFVIGHSQGCPTSVILLERLFKSGIITPSTQRICLTLMAGVFEGPTPRFEIMEMMRPLIEELGDRATLELFDFQKSTSDISLALHDAYTTMIKSRVKMVQLGVGNDEVVPLHSSLFTSVKHPSIYRAFYVNGEICQQKSFLSDFVALLIKILNHGHSDSGLLGYVSEALIGALSDEGHSSIIREDVAYRRAIDVFFDSISHQLTDSPIFYDFNYTSPQMKPCFISWAMRGLLMNDKVITADNIAPDIADLCRRFLEWKPVTPQSRLIKDALEPIGVTRERKGIPVLRDSEPLKT